MPRKTPRNGQNYRGARRNMWREHNALSPNGRMPWESYNSRAGYQIGTPQAKYRANVRRDRYGDRVVSKYMPHIGAKQRAKAAAKAA